MKGDLYLETNYPSNSNASKERKKKETTPAPPEKKVEKVITGKAIAKKPGMAKKFTDIFVAEDAKSVGEHIFMDVLLPKTKDLLVDIVCGSINMFVYGDSGARVGRSNADRYGYGSRHTNYNRISTSARDNRPAHRYENARSYDDIYLETRGEAEAVLDAMFGMLDEYGTVSVADLYDLVGITGNFTDCKYGWTDLRTATTQRTRDGLYVLKLPRAIAL